MGFILLKVDDFQLQCFDPCHPTLIRNTFDGTFDLGFILINPTLNKTKQKS